MLPLKVIKLLLFVVFISQVNSYKILVVFPTGSYSHQQPQQAVSQGLADAGHEVTIISPNTFKTKNPNIRQIDINITYECMQIFDLSSSLGPFDLLKLVNTYNEMMADKVFAIPEVMDVYKNVKNEQFDAVVMEPLYHIPFFAIKETYNTTLIGLASLEMLSMYHKTMGNVIHPVLHPSFFQGTDGKPSFVERIGLAYFHLVLSYYENYIYNPTCNGILRKYFPEVKSTAESLIKSFDFMVEGITPVLSNPRPLTPNTVQVGFLHIKEPKALPKDLQNYLDNSKNGVIYFSLGSNVRSADLKPEISQILIKTINQLNYDVLWKFENDTIADKPDNVRIEKWLPQTDLLHHKNIKLFITQGGIQSTQETIASGVPVVVIPFFGDQDANAKKIVQLGIGKRVDIEEFSVEKLKTSILEVIDNPK